MSDTIKCAKCLKILNFNEENVNEKINEWLCRSCDKEFEVEFEKFTSEFIANKAMTQWIKCSDRLPEDNEYVLAYDGSDIYLLKFNQDSDKRHKIRNGYFRSSSEEEWFDEIKCWMPLPEPPEEGE
jgi:hypothetical protein